MNSLLAEFVSLLVGVITGFVFERRATNGAKRYNEDLLRQISVLKTSIFNLSGKPDGKQAALPAPDLAGLITQRAIATQDPAGRVDRRALIAHFVEHDYAPRDINEVISSLCQTGIAEEDGLWLQMV